MRKLATRLHCSPMALYRHVADKQTLIGAIADHYLADLELPDTDGVAVAGGDRRGDCRGPPRVSRPPALEEILAVRHVDTMAVFRADEVILRALAEAGLDGRAAVHALDVFTSYAVGATLRQAAKRASSPAEDDRLRRLRALPAEDFPFVREQAGELVTVDFTLSFEDGLRLLIDGVERRVSG